MLLKIENLSVSYRGDADEEFCAAKNVDLELERGETLGLVGESGSGKSSVAMSVARLLPEKTAVYPTGRILFNGEDVLKMDERRLREIRGRKIGVVFQDPIGSLSPLHPIGEQLTEAVHLHRKMSEAAARDLALEWLAKTGIPEPAVRYRALPHELSGGMQQRVMIAMALINEPSLVIADEPTTALDVTVQAQILALLEKLTAGRSAVLLITHDLGVVSQMATRLAVMKRGVIVERSEDPAAFFAAPQHEYSRRLVAEALKTAL